MIPAAQIQQPGYYIYLNADDNQYSPGLSLILYNSLQILNSAFPGYPVFKDVNPFINMPGCFLDSFQAAYNTV